MICEVCQRTDVPCCYEPDRSGLVRLLCADCAKQAARLADGSHQGNRPMTDFADHVGAERADEIRIAIARADAAIDCLRTLVKAWRKEMRGGYATTEQQHALRRAEEMIK